MPVVEIRDSEVVRQYVLQGLWLQRLNHVSEDSVAQSLQILMELAISDAPIPPAGFVADLSHLVFGQEHTTAKHSEQHSIDFLPADVSRAYEDYVLGKLYADATFERGSTAICRYKGSDRNRGAAWLLARFLERSEAGGIRCSPNIIRSLQREPVDELLAEGSQSLRDDGLLPMLEEHYRELIMGVRKLGEVLAPEDVFELEYETALVEFGQRLALRQVLSVASRLQTAVPHMVPNPFGRERSVATNLLAEDSYPVGGFTSISTRGTIESLLQSQLALMETDENSRPDLFDIRYLRSELLYYSRDENEFLRRRRTFVFALYPDLVNCRVKDDCLPCQRIIVLLALLYVAVEQLVEWLNNESLKFEILLVGSRGESPLTDEHELIALLLRKHIAHDAVIVSLVSPSELELLVEDASRRSLTHYISLSCTDRDINVTNALATRLIIGNPIPTLAWEHETQSVDIDDLNGWKSATDRLLRLLV